MPDDDDSRSGDPIPGSRLDVPTLQTLAQRAATHPLVDGWAFDPSSVSPRILQFYLTASAYPTEVTAARIDARWFVTGATRFTISKNEKGRQSRSSADGIDIRKRPHREPISTHRRTPATPNRHRWTHTI